jgi:hypothetical protein
VAEFQQQQFDPRGVSLARLLASEFGMFEDGIRKELDAKGTEIEIDGEKWQGDRRFIPEERLRGKTLTVMGPERHWQLKYPEHD